MRHQHHFDDSNTPQFTAPETETHLPPKSFISRQFGDLYEADQFVLQDFEPGDENTRLHVLALLDELGLTATRPTTQKKYVLAVSDFLMCVKHSTYGLISWPGGTDVYTGGPYGAEIARKVRGTIIESGFLSRIQKSSTLDQLAAVYRADPAVAPPWLKFKHHGLGPTVQVRSQKTLDPDTGRKVGGRPLSRKGFLPEILPLEEQVKEINRVLAKHPLEMWCGAEHGRVKRIFNNGSLTSGGRLYGPWQRESEDERLRSSIDGQSVCEIDLKASYVAIANAVLGDGAALGSDPYQQIKFVRSANDGPDRTRMREAAKTLVSAYISKRGVMNRFPKGRKSKTLDPHTSTYPTISFKEKYGLSGPVTEYLEDIFVAFPFLTKVPECQHDFMFMESEIIVSSVADLAAEGIPAYPVHDCLLVKIADQDKAIEALQTHMIRLLGTVVDMDVTHLDDDAELVTSLVAGPEEMTISTKGKPVFVQATSDLDLSDDFDLIDDGDQ